MAGRQTRGRQRIPMRLIESQDDLYASFSKRRLGLYKKASELSTLCGVDIGVIIFSPRNHPFSFFSPSMESVIDRYRNPNQPLSDHARLVEAHTRARIEHLNQRLDEIQEEKEQLKEREKQLDEIDKTRQKGWWEQVPVESLTKEQVKEWKAWFQDFKAKVNNRMEELRNGASTSAAAFQVDQNAPPPSGGGGSETAIVPNTFGQNFVVPPPSSGPSYVAPEFGSDQYFPPTQYYSVPPQAADHPFSDSGSGHYPGQFYGLPPPGQGPSRGGGSVGQFPIQYNYIPPPVQDPSSSGGQFPFQYSYFRPPPPQDPSSSAVGGSGYHHLPIQYNYILPPPQDTSTSRRGAGEAGPSHQGNTNP